MSQATTTAGSGPPPAAASMPHPASAAALGLLRCASCELVLALDAMGDTARARELFATIQHLRHDDGSYWTGWQYANERHFPSDRSTYTAAAVILAADALVGGSPSARLFKEIAGRELGPAGPADPVACGCEARSLADSLRTRR